MRKEFINSFYVGSTYEGDLALSFYINEIDFDNKIRSELITKYFEEWNKIIVPRTIKKVMDNFFHYEEIEEKLKVKLKIEDFENPEEYNYYDDAINIKFILENPEQTIDIIKNNFEYLEKMNYYFKNVRKPSSPGYWSLEPDSFEEWSKFETEREGFALMFLILTQEDFVEFPIDMEENPSLFAAVNTEIVRRLFEEKEIILAREAKVYDIRN